MQKLTRYTYLFVVAVVGIASTLVVNYFILAWTAPASGPPDGGVNTTINWSDIDGIPLDIADGDDIGTFTETDPTVTNTTVKDGVSWTEIGGTCPVCGTCWATNSFNTCTHPTQSDAGLRLCTPSGWTILWNQNCQSP